MNAPGTSAVVVMGVCGCGKSTVGTALAAAAGARFFDADDFHPPENVAKMAAGDPLGDADRAPWLARLRAEVIGGASPAAPCVLACSALKARYREVLAAPGVGWLYLRGSRALLAERLGGRAGHFMKAGMLASQLADLEEPPAGEALAVDISAPVPEIVARALKQFSLKS